MPPKLPNACSSLRIKIYHHNHQSYEAYTISDFGSEGVYIQNMKIAIVFPTNRGFDLRGHLHRKLPDNAFFGINYLRKKDRLVVVSVFPSVEFFLNIFLGPFLWPFQSRFTRLNLGRAVLTLPLLRKSDIVISCVDSMNKSLLLLKKLHFFHASIICMAGNVMDRTERFPTLHRWLWSVANRVVTHAPVDQEKLERMGLGDLGVMIPVGSDESFYRPNLREVDSDLVASIGSDRDRDYETLVSAARNLPHLTFEIHAAQQNIRSADLPENVRLVTDASPMQSRDLLQRASIVVIPLKETGRSAGQLALMDALLMKKAVIVSSARGAVEPYQLKHRQSAFLVPPGSVEILIRAIKILYADAALRRKLDEEGRRLALRYTTKRYAEKLRCVIDDVLKTTVRSAS